MNKTQLIPIKHNDIVTKHLAFGNSADSAHYFMNELKLYTYPQCHCKKKFNNSTLQLLECDIT